MLGRNDRCHCGSGKKYKRCHLPKEQAHAAVLRRHNPPPPPEVLKTFRDMERQRQEHLARYGHAREAVHGNFQGYKFVAVGGTLHYSSEWRNFTDFLVDYVKPTLSQALGPEWYPAERAKAPEMRHPIVRWYEAFCELGANATRNADGFLEAAPDGQTQAYLSLAYDLYVVGDNARLQTEVIRRLRDPAHFQGARYELGVAATMLRAGFTIEFEDESDSSRRHPEFVAAHRATGARVAVEAKSRRRRGVLGWVGPRPDPAAVQLSVGELLKSACEKTTDLPLIVFIDANMPPEMANKDFGRWVNELHDTLPRVAHGFGAAGVFEGVPFSLLVVTNTPHDYAARGEFSAQSGVYMSQPHPARHPLPNPQMMPAIERALRQSANIPGDFPTDPREGPNRDAET